MSKRLNRGLDPMDDRLFNLLAGSTLAIHFAVVSWAALAVLWGIDLLEIVGAGDETAQSCCYSEGHVKARRPVVPVWTDDFADSHTDD